MIADQIVSKNCPWVERIDGKVWRAVDNHKGELNCSANVKTAWWRNDVNECNFCCCEGDLKDHKRNIITYISNFKVLPHQKIERCTCL